MSSQQTQAVVRLNVKLARAVNPSRAEEAFRSIPGLSSVIQTFPGESDEELSRMYVLEVEPDALKPALRHLRDNPDVEHVEQTAKRKLIW